MLRRVLSPISELIILVVLMGFELKYVYHNAAIAELSIAYDIVLWVMIVVAMLVQGPMNTDRSLVMDSTLMMLRAGLRVLVLFLTAFKLGSALQDSASLSNSYLWQLAALVACAASVWISGFVTTIQSIRHGIVAAFSGDGDEHDGDGVEAASAEPEEALN